MSRFDDDALDRFHRGVWFTIPLHAWVRLSLQWAISIGAAVAMYGVPIGPALYLALNGPPEVPEPDFDEDEDTFYALDVTDDLDPEPVEVAAPVAAPTPEAKIRRVRLVRPDSLPRSVPEPPEPPPVLAEDPVAEQETPDEVVERRQRRPRRPPKKPRIKSGVDPKAPCEPADGIEALGDGRWLVKRELVEFYATHPFQLDQLATVWTHKDAAGEPDGFKIGLPRCTVLRAAGFKSSDVVNDINGRVISTIPQAIGAYFVLRREEVYFLHITRRDPKTKASTQLELAFEIEEKDRTRRRDRVDAAVDTDAGDAGDETAAASSGTAPEAPPATPRRRRDR